MPCYGTNQQAGFHADATAGAQGAGAKRQQAFACALEARPQAQHSMTCTLGQSQWHIYGIMLYPYCTAVFTSKHTCASEPVQGNSEHMTKLRRFFALYPIP